MMNKLKIHLKKIKLNNYQIEKIEAIFDDILILEKGEYFLKQDRVCEQFGFILVGMCRYFHKVNNEEVTNWVSLHNEFIVSSNSFAMQTKAIENIQAIKTTEILITSAEKWQQLMADEEFAEQLWQLINKQNYFGIENQNFDFFKLNATERYNWFLNRQPQFNTLIPIKYLAPILGVDKKN